MSQPLKDIVAELEAKYKGFELSYDLEERRRVIDEFYLDMAYLFSRLEKYEEDVIFILERKLDVNSITRLTMNLAVVVQHFCVLLDKYDYALESYLMDERYETNHDLHIKFTESFKKIQNLFDKLQENNVFEVEKPDEGEVIRNVFYDGDRNEDYIEIKPQNFHSEVAEKLNGAELLVCLNFLLEYFDDTLYEVKSLDIKWKWSEMSRIFELNYLFYAKNYWPKKALNFRSHVEHYYLQGKNAIDALEKVRYDKIRDFEKTPIGGIWRDHSENKIDMARQMKDHKLEEEQWKDFFQRLFEIEELDRWIDELRNPPETEEEKQKRERLLRTNIVFTLQPTKSKKKVDILFLYNYIDTRFVPETKFVYEWYALYYIFKRNGIINTCTIEDFAKQMNDTEWFAHVDKRCKANEINSYRFLDTKAPDAWEKVKAPLGNRASTKALKNIFRRYYLLNDSLDEIYEK